MTDHSDVERLGDEPLDVLVAHEAPAGLDLAAWQLPAEDQIRTDQVRSLIATAVEATQPRIVFHGHWHHVHDTELSWIDRVATEQSGGLVWRSSASSASAATVTSPPVGQYSTSARSTSRGRTRAA